MKNIKDLTDNELKALKVLFKESAEGFGVEQVSDYYDDWAIEGMCITATELTSNGWSKKSAEGTIASLVAEGFLYVYEDHETNVPNQLAYFVDQKGMNYLLELGFTTVESL